MFLDGVDNILQTTLILFADFGELDKFVLEIVQRLSDYVLTPLSFLLLAGSLVDVRLQLLDQLVATLQFSHQLRDLVFLHL